MNVPGNNDGMLVARRWLERADEKLNKRDAASEIPKKAPTSRFYDIRPCKLTSAFVNGKATANLIVNGAEDSSSIDVYDVTGQAASVGLTTGAYCYVTYRGKWEVVSCFARSSSGVAGSLTFVSGFSLSNGVLIANETTATVLIPSS